MTEETQPTEPTASMAPEPTAPEPMAPPAPVTPASPAAPAPPPAAPVGWAAPPAPAANAVLAGARPTTIVIAAVLASIDGVLLALLGVFIMFGSGLLGGAIGSEGGNGADALGGAVAGIGIAAGIIVVLIALCYLAVAIGNYRGRSWSWPLGIIVWVLSLLLGFGGIAGGRGVVALILEVGFPIAALFCLLQADARRFLGR